MAYYTYILRCEGGTLYTGITTDLARRFFEHASKGGKGAKYTALRKPLCYEAAWRSSGRAEASRLEYRIKSLTRAEKQQLILGVPPAGFDMSAYSRVEDLPACGL